MEQINNAIWEEFKQYLQKMAEDEMAIDDEMAPKPANFHHFIQNLEGRKQLRFTNLSLTLYNNGQVLYTFYFSPIGGGYELGYALDYLHEKLKFEYGYTEQEVHEAYADYLDKLNNQLGGYNEEN